MMHRGASIYEFKRFYPNMADWGQKWSRSTYGQNTWAILIKYHIQRDDIYEISDMLLLSVVYLM